MFKNIEAEISEFFEYFKNKAEDKVFKSQKDRLYFLYLKINAILCV